MKFPPLSDAMRTALLDNLGPGAYANAVHLDKAYAAMVLAAGGAVTPVKAWSYTNAHGKVFLSETDPATWHPHDREGFENFQALVPAGAAEADQAIAADWRRLALQFDGHRMQAIGLLRVALAEMSEEGGAVAQDIQNFLSAAPLSGEAVLNERLAAMVTDAQVKAPSPADEVARIVAQRADRARRIYIAGPMTGLPEYNFPAFNAKADELRAAGWHVENPADHGLVEGAKWDDYMRWDLARVATCGAIYLLPGWTDSKGATLEEQVAKVLAMSFQGAVVNAEERPIAIMRDNDRSIEAVKTPGWKLHRCPDDAQCRATIGGGCAGGWCAHFEVKPDEEGVSRFSETTIVAAGEPAPAPAITTETIAGWRVEHDVMGPAFTHHQVQAELWIREGRSVTALVAQGKNS